MFTRQLHRVSRGEDAITAVTFVRGGEHPECLPDSVEFLVASDLSSELAERQFDFVVAVDLLDKRICTHFLQDIERLLKPGGQVLLYESNPWNAFLKARRAIGRLFGSEDSRQLMSRPEPYELISEVGFIRVFAVFNDFVYRPLNPRLSWLMRYLSILLRISRGSGGPPGRSGPRPKTTSSRAEAERLAVRARVASRFDLSGDPLS